MLRSNRAELGSRAAYIRPVATLMWEATRFIHLVEDTSLGGMVVGAGTTAASSDNTESTTSSQRQPPGATATQPSAAARRGPAASTAMQPTSTARRGPAASANRRPTAAQRRTAHSRNAPAAAPSLPAQPSRERATEGRPQANESSSVDSDDSSSPSRRTRSCNSDASASVRSEARSVDCFRCEGHISRHRRGTLCSEVTCSRALCTKCHPNLRVSIRCDEHRTDAGTTPTAPDAGALSVGADSIPNFDLPGSQDWWGPAGEGSPPLPPGVSLAQRPNNASSQGEREGRNRRNTRQRQPGHHYHKK